MRIKSLIVIQVIIVLFLGYKIFHNVSLKNPSINPIIKKNITYNSNNKLKYFYEPRVNNVEIETLAWLPKKIKYTINSDSLNERYNYSINKPKSVYRVITLGDSFTFGQNVDTEDNWAEKLEDLLNKKLNCKNINKFEVINLGVKGYDIQYAANRFFLRGRKYNSDMVIWFLKDDDFEIIEELIQPMRVELVDELKKRVYKNLSKNTNFEETLEGYQLLVSQFKKKYNYKYVLNYNKKIINEFLNQYKGKIIIFNYTSFRINGIKEMLEEFAQKNSNFFWKESLTPNFDNKIYAFAPYNYHPNEKGYKLIANNLSQSLIGNKILSCD